MQIRLIAGMSTKEKGVGFQNTIPWKQSADMNRFKQLTTEDGIMILGSNTFKSFNGYVLPGRIHIVLTSTPVPSEDERVMYVGSMEEAISVAKDLIDQGKGKAVSVIGGARVWKDGVEHADVLNLTFVDTDESVQFDTFFPELDMGQWKEVSREIFLKDEKNMFTFTFVDYVRV